MRPLVKATALPICYGKSPYEDRMKNILDALNGNGGLKAGLGNMGDTLKNTLQNVGAGSPGGIGGLLGSAALVKNCYIFLYCKSKKSEILKYH